MGNKNSKYELQTEDVTYRLKNNEMVLLNSLDENKWLANNISFYSGFNVYALILIPNFRMEDETVKKIYDFLRKYEKYCQLLVFAYKQNIRHQSSYRFLFLPNHFEKVVIKIEILQLVQMSLFKNISSMNIKNVVFSYDSNSFNCKEQIFSVIRDSFSYKSNIIIDNPYLASILSYSFFNKENLNNLKEIKTKSLEGKSKITFWRKHQLTTVIREMGRNKELKWTTDERNVSYNDLLMLAWK